MLLLCSTEFYGASVLMDQVFADSRLDRSGFDRPGKLARAMEGMK